MSLESATKISEMVATNPPGTDPVSQGDDHIRMIKQVLKNNAIKSEIGQSATPANNFTLDASADDGTMKLSRSSGQDIMTVDAAGKVTLNQQGVLKNREGFIELGKGVHLQWGKILTDSSGIGAVTFPSGMSYTNVLPVSCAANSGAFIGNVSAAGPVGIELKGMVSGTGAAAPGLELNWVCVTIL